MNHDVSIWGLHHNGGLPLVDEDRIAIGWQEVGDLSDLANERDAFKHVLRGSFPDKSDSWISNAAGQLLRFRYNMALGDMVVYPRKSDRTINIGEIVGDYTYDVQWSSLYPNIREVRWLAKELPRDRFSQGCLYEFGSALSVFQVKTHVKEVFDSLDSTTAPAADETPLGGISTPPAEDEPDVERIAELTEDFILKTFQSELKGHGFAQFCGWLLEAMGYSAKVSPPGVDKGIDIEASEDALGVKRPLLKVQCKSSSDGSGAPEVQALNGTLGPDDEGVFFSVAGFTHAARQAASGMPRMRLIEPVELVDLILTHYERLPDEAKQELPLRRVWMPEKPTPNT